MISLEGLTLVTYRFDDARAILPTRSRHMREGLVPNMFPEGGQEGTYDTADASRWLVHALAVRDRLLTPMGLRTLEPGHPDYIGIYEGDKPARDAAYHPGTIWPWLPWSVAELLRALAVSISRFRATAALSGPSSSPLEEWLPSGTSLASRERDVTVAGFALVGRRAPQGWLAAILGVWFFIAGFFVSLLVGSGLWWNNLLVGLALIVTGFTAVRAIAASGTVERRTV